MRIPIHQIDAFADRPFSGNPAAVCPLEEWLADERLQAIAAENNLSETAFYLPEGNGYRLRWFTPACEVDLCGHATLAAAFVLFDSGAVTGDVVRFQTHSGELLVYREGDLLALDFPSRPPLEVTPDPNLITALGGVPQRILAARDYLVVYASEAEVRALRPDMRAVAAVDKFAVIVTAPGGNCDFVSRFFAPAKGVEEDPVTGSAHCTLIPYWADRLGKKQLHAIQASRRGGELWCELRDGRVRIAGKAVRFLEGVISL